MNETQLTFIHMTDVHILAKDAEPFLGIHTAPKLKRAIEHIKSSGVKPAFFAISGDIIQDAEDDAYEHVKEILSELDDFDVPVLLTLGNHDNREAFQRVFLGETDVDESRRYYHSHIFNGVKVILLDSRETGKVHGTFDDEQMDWLKTELAAGEPTILIFHHPPIVNAYAMLDDHILAHDSIEKLANAIEGQNVIGILNGHIHFDSAGSFHGVPVFAGGHVAFTLDPFDTEGMKFLDGSSFNIVSVKNGQFLVNPMLIAGEQKVLRYVSNEEMARAMADHN